MFEFMTSRTVDPKHTTILMRRGHGRGCARGGGWGREDADRAGGRTAVLTPQMFVCEVNEER